MGGPREPGLNEGGDRGFPGPGVAQDVALGVTGPPNASLPALIACVITSPAPGATLTVGVPTSITETISQAGSVVVNVGSVALGAATVVGLTWSCAFTPTLPELGAQTIGATATATVGGATGAAPGVAVTVAHAVVFGPVAGRVIVPNTTLSGGSYNWEHPIKIDIGAGRVLTSIKVAFANWFGGGETATGGTLSANAQLEYPSGTFTRLLFSGGALGSVASGGTLWSDGTEVLAVPVPDGATAILHGRVQNSVAVPYCNTMFGDVASGDALVSNASDLTGTTLTDALGGGMFPQAICGTTALPTYGILGDSIAAGANDNSVDSAGHRGVIQRALSGFSGART